MFLFELLTCNLQDSRHPNNLQDVDICTLLHKKHLIILVCVIYLSSDIITNALVVQNLIKDIIFTKMLITYYKKADNLYEITVQGYTPSGIDHYGCIILISTYLNPLHHCI